MGHQVLNYKITKLIDKQVVELSPTPLFIEGREGLLEIKTYYADVIPLIESGEDISAYPKAVEYLDLMKNFTDPKLRGKVDINSSTNTIHAYGRNEGIKQIELANGIKYLREFIWIDGAESTPGQIVLPHDDYDKVYYIYLDELGNYQLEWLNEYIEGMEKPFYYKQDGKTFIEVEHFSGGGGTQTVPYLVSNPTDLDAVRNNLSAYYEQTVDIDMTGVVFLPVAPTESIPFAGTYDGGGYKISNLVINHNISGEYTGLFGVVNGGTIKNVNIVNCDIRGDYVMGALAGMITGGGTVEKCSSSGIIRPIAGDSTTSWGQGGLLGGINGSSILRNSYSHCTITRDGAEPNNRVGGLVGGAFTSGTTIDNCYSTGKVGPGQSYIGGLVGQVVDAVFTSCYWDTETSGMTTSAAGVGKTTTEMKTQSTYVNWDFVNVWTMTSADGYPALITTATSDTTPPGELNITSSIWSQMENGSYGVDFQYTLPTDTDLDRILVYRDSVVIDDYVASGSGGYHDEVTERKVYTYKFATVDTSGNESTGVEVTIDMTDTSTSDPTNPYPDGYMRLVAGQKILNVSVVFLENAGQLSHPYLRVITQSKIGVFKLKKLSEVSSPNAYPLRIITQQDIFVFETNEAT